MTLVDYTTAIELDPINASYYYNRAYVKMEQHDYGGAIADYDMVISIDPKNAAPYLNRGASKIMLGQKDSGCLDLSKAGELGDTKAYGLIKKYCN